MPKNSNNTYLTLAIIGIIGFVILFHNINEDGGTWTDILTLEILGWLLVGIALTLGVLYFISPFPVKYDRPQQTSCMALFPGGDVDICAGGSIDEHAAIEGGDNVLDNVILTD